MLRRALVLTLAMMCLSATAICIAAYSVRS